jgi:hypothetical protein
VRLGSISGTVTDETGAALPGVTITMTSPALQVPQLLKTSGAEGEYQFTDLPPGLYRVTYELSGFGTLVREQIRLTTGFAARLDVSLKLASVAETVTVIGASPLVDVTNTRGGTTVSQELLRATPNSGTMQDAFLISGGVKSTTSPLNGEGGLRAIGTVYTTFTYGQSVTGIPQQTLDGVMTYSNQFPDLSSVEEVDVKTYGNTAEVGPPGFNTVLIVKSGGNQFHGRIKEAYQGKAFQSSNVDDRLRAQGISTGRKLGYLSDFSGDLGGRLIRDKLWFYGAYHDQRSDQYLAGFNLRPGPSGQWDALDAVPAVDKLVEPVPTIKFSYQATKDHRVVGMFSQNTIIESASGAARFVPFQSTIDYSQPFPTAKAEWQGTFGSKLVVSTIAGWHYIGAYRNPQPCCASLISTFDLITQQQTGSVWNSLRGWRRSTRYQQSGLLNYYPGGSFFGSHQISTGYYLLPEKFRVFLPVAASGDYRLVYNNGVPAQLWTRNTPVNGTSWQNWYSVFVSDSWRATRRLTMNLGLRLDRLTANIPAQVKEQGPWPFGRTGPLPEVHVGNWTALAPRLGAAFDLFGNGKTVVKATYGSFNHNYEYGWIGQFNPNYTAETRYRWTDPTRCNCYVPGTINLDPNGADVLSVTGSTNTIVNANLKLTHTHEVTSTIERELPHAVSVRALYVYKREVGTKATFNTARPLSAWNQQIVSRDPGPDGKLITFYDFDPAFRGSRFVVNTLVNASDRISHWHNLEFTLQKRQSGRWFALTSLLLTKNHRWLTSVVQSPNDEIFPLDKSWVWSYRMSAGYLLPYDIMLSTITQADNGVQGQRTVVFTAPTSGTISVPVEPFATKGPVRKVINLRGSRDLTLGAGRKLGLELDVFNVFNTNVPWAQNFVSGSRYGFFTEYASPRVLRLGATFEF